MFATSMNLLIFTIGEFMISRDRKYITIKRAFINPTILAVMVAIPLYLLRIKLPSGIQSINSTVDALHSANENLGEGVANISGLIENLSAISEENAATAQELNATTDTVNNSVVVLAENGDNVSKSAMDLERIISEFKVDPMDITMDKE